MTTNPRISIIIPTYNYRGYIRQAIDSALAQTYDNFEVIVVDDGSTDNSWDIITSYVNGFKIRPIWQENSGVSAARNNGIKNSTGEFFLPLDADDWLEPNYLEKTVPQMQDPTVAIVSTDYLKFGVDSSYQETSALTLEHEFHGNGIPNTSLVRRAAFDQTPGYSTVFVERKRNKQALGYEDWNLWLDILKRGWKTAVVHEPLYHYRTKATSVWVPAPPGGCSPEVFAVIKSLHPDLYG